MAEITKLDRLYKQIYDMAIGEEFVFNPKWSKEDMEWLLSEIKAYIQFGYDRMYGYQIELSKDFNKFRKQSI